MNTQRRIFRGRGGPTDRRLPKHNARRSKLQRPRQRSNDECDGVESVEEEESKSSSDVQKGDHEVMPTKESELASVKQDPDPQPEYHTDANHDDSICITTPKLETHPSSKELKHLQKRIRNIQESMQLSANAIANPATYKQNVLNSVSNCINEWRAIVMHYNDDDLDPQVFKSVALAIFVLLQFSLQCGPLAGAKPGYFKRCGGAVAKVAASFLQEVLENDLVRMGFTEKQLAAVEQWKKNADAAVLQDKPPSKSAIKKQTQGVMSVKSKKKAKNKNKG